MGSTCLASSRSLPPAHSHIFLRERLIFLFLTRKSFPLFWTLSAGSMWIFHFVWCVSIYKLCFSHLLRFTLSLFPLKIKKMTVKSLFTFWGGLNSYASVHWNPPPPTPLAIDNAFAVLFQLLAIVNLKTFTLWWQMLTSLLIFVVFLCSFVLCSQSIWPMASLCLSLFLEQFWAVSWTPETESVRFLSPPKGYPGMCRWG